MKRGGSVLLLMSLLGLLLSCSSGQTPKKTAPTEAMTKSRSPFAVIPGKSASPPPSLDKAQEKHNMAAKTAVTSMQEGQGESKPAAKKNRAADAEAVAPPAATNGDGRAIWNEPWQKFLANLPTAAYTFNVPSPITVDTPHPIYLWVDTTVTQQALAEELKKLEPRDASQVKSGFTKVSPVMEASLTGPGEEFIVIKPDTPQPQSLNLNGRTAWKWTITPKRTGTYPLDIKLVVIPPPDIATAPHEIQPSPALHHTIQVEVTLWWLFDHFFDKYWKWLLGGLGTLLVTVLGWWWQKRSGQKA